MLIAGIDEAGRGPCLGPMVLAVATVEKRDEDCLLEIGVKDSKLLSPAVRVQQNGQLRKALKEFCVTRVGASEIDKLRDRQSLNEIEAMRAGLLLNSLKKKPDIVYIDSPDIIQENFGKRIEKYISFDTILKTEHKADMNYPIVSAASILAKVDRDKCIERLAKKHGNIGSGYPHDADTISFMKKFVAKNKKLPSFARKSWSTSQKMLNGELQSSLGEFK
jgi:ribonuclease HII